MSVKPGLHTLALAIGLAACSPGASTPISPAPTGQPTQQVVTRAPAPPPTATPAALLEPARIVEGDVADWPGSWSPDSRFYVFFHWREDLPCTGEVVYAYDFEQGHEIRLSSEDYCATNVDPDQIWDGESTLFFGDGPGGMRWEAITLGDEVTRQPLPEPPPTCVDRDIPLPPALAGLETARARWSPDEDLLALALVPQDDTYRFGDIPGNQPDLTLFQRLDLVIFPSDGSSQADLQPLGPIFDLGPDALGPEDTREEGCPGTHIRWSDDGQIVTSSIGPFVYTAAGDAWLAPEGPNAGPLGPNLRWSPDDRRLADDQRLLDLPSGQLFEPPGILPGFDRGFAGPDTLIYVNDTGLAAFSVESRATHQLTGFRKGTFVVSPDGSILVYAGGGDLWALDLRAIPK